MRRAIWPEGSTPLRQSQTAVTTLCHITQHGAIALRLAAFAKGELSREEFGERYTADAPILDCLHDDNWEETIDRFAQYNTMSSLGANSTFSAEILAEYTTVDIDITKRFLACFGVGFQDVSADFVQPTPSTPFSTKPYLGSGDTWVRVNCDAYSYLLPRLNSLMNHAKNDASSAKQWDRYHTKRDAFLERKTIELFKRMMPMALVEHSLRYPVSDDPKDGDTELDGLVVHDNNILLIEAKASAVSDSTRRGSNLKLVADAKKSIYNATEQAERAARYILQSDKQPLFARKDGSRFSLDVPPVKHVYRVVVTLDHMDPVLVNTSSAVAAGLVPAVENYWSVGLRDLIVFADLIQYPTELLHYINRRNHLFKRHPMIVTDEIDLLGNYISNQRLYFDGVVKQEGAVIYLVSHTEDIDNFYNFEQGARTKKTEKPHLSFPDTIHKLLESLERNPRPCYSEASMRFFSMSGYAHEQFAKGVSKCIQRCLDRGTHSSIAMSLDNARYGITYFVFPESDAKEIKHKLGFYLTEKHKREGYNSWVAIATLVSKPYEIHSVGMISDGNDRNF